MLAHDLNHDLGVILERCGLLKQSLKGNSEATRQNQAIAGAARRMAQMVARHRLARRHRNQPADAAVEQG